jgi:hypothetical protein
VDHRYTKHFRIAMDWREYERAVFKEFKARYPKSSISMDVNLPGQLSGVGRQIDVLIDASVAGQPFRTVVDAKMYNRPIDVKDVKEFLGMVEDVGAQRGMMVTTIGYTPAAQERAHHDARDIELDVMSLAEFQKFQYPLGFPYSGERGVFLRAPFGWVVDNSGITGHAAILYQRGRDFDTAARVWEWAYLDFWHKDVEGTLVTIDELLAKQDADLKEWNAATEIEHLDSRAESRHATAIRLAKLANRPVWEYTGIINFPEFMFFVVVLTPPQVANRNLRKLNEILSWALPVNIHDERQDKSKPAAKITVHVGEKRIETSATVSRWNPHFRKPKMPQ